MITTNICLPQPGVLGPGGGLLQHEGGLHPVELRLPVQQPCLAGQLRPHPGQLQHVSTQPRDLANIITVRLYSCRLKIQAWVGFICVLCCQARLQWGSVVLPCRGPCLHYMPGRQAQQQIPPQLLVIRGLHHACAQQSSVSRVLPFLTDTGPWLSSKPDTGADWSPDWGPGS